MNQPDPEYVRQILRKVRQIEIRTNRDVADGLGGCYHGAFKGQGIDFEEVREYLPGDEVRSIDWNVTARTGVPFVKQYVEERELTLLLAVDVSASSSFGSKLLSKREKMAELAALLAFSANRNGDKVGLLLFSDRKELYLPPAKGQMQVLRILREVLFHETISEKTNLFECVRYVNQVTRRRAVVFLLSDFIFAGSIGGEETSQRSFLDLACSTRRKHDLICARIFDPVERELPRAGLVNMQDPETGEQFLFDTSDSRILQSYHKEIDDKARHFRKSLRRRGLDFFEFSNDSDFTGELRGFFRMREKRRCL